jgi:hypothetical protein
VVLPKATCDSILELYKHRFKKTLMIFNVLMHDKLSLPCVNVIHLIPAQKIILRQDETGVEHA